LLEVCSSINILPMAGWRVRGKVGIASASLSACKQRKQHAAAAAFLSVDSSAVVALALCIIHLHLELLVWLDRKDILIRGKVILPTKFVESKSSGKSSDDGRVFILLSCLSREVEKQSWF